MRARRHLSRFFFVFAVVFASAAAAKAQEQRARATRPSVFVMPQVHAQFNQRLLLAQMLMQQGNDAAAEQQLATAVKLMPEAPAAHYNLACALARQKKTEAAFAALSKAVETGFNSSQHIKADEDLKSLRDDPRFDGLVKASAAAEPANLWRQQIQSSLVEDGEAWVRESNTAYDPRNGLLLSFFNFPPKTTERDGKEKDAEEKEEQPNDAASQFHPIDKPIMTGKSELAKLLAEWKQDGTAAGNYGDLYDNHDSDHSNMNYGAFPQLTRIEYGEAAKKYGLHHGLQVRLMYNAVTLGNSSTAMTSGPFWRSQARLAYTDRRAVGVLAAQYYGNHLFIYPEHRDHDPGHNGEGGGYGDVYPANTPYLIISQGSSGSDRVFLNAVAGTLAAFRPEVKRLLASKQALMPTVQMIFRMSNKNIESENDYLTGAAHPTVFDGKQVDEKQMAKMAHSITADTTPPLVQLSVVEEDEPVVGRDYFFPGPGEKLFDSPAAIARVYRSTRYSRRMIVSAEKSRDLNGKPLKFQWKVLRGDAERIEIKPQNEMSSVVELSVPYHTRQPIAPGSNMHSNRVDIGAFVFNGEHYSAPAFVTFFFLDNEMRTYRHDHLIQSVEYRSRGNGGNYVDPLVDLPKNWRDEYRYDEKNRLIGWTRTTAQDKQSFTADGALVLEHDETGRATKARTVRYIRRQTAQNNTPSLEQTLGSELLLYEYESPGDRVGRIKSRQQLTAKNGTTS